MEYITKNDLRVLAKENYIDSSSDDFQDAINLIEQQNIAIIKAYLEDLYDVETIFDTQEPIRNGIIIYILARLVVYNVIRRNSARKVPDDFKDMYKAAMEKLEDIAFGKITLNNLPKPDKADEAFIKHGSLKNKNYYI